MDANELKKAAAQAALQYVEDDALVGVGTGSTVNFFIDALASRRARIKGTVASSEASARRLRDLHIPVLELNNVLISFSFAVVIGVFSGLYPAWKASRIEPIEALRYG